MSKLLFVSNFVSRDHFMNGYVLWFGQISSVNQCHLISYKFCKLCQIWYFISQSWYYSLFCEIDVLTYENSYHCRTCLMDMDEFWRAYIFYALVWLSAIISTFCFAAEFVCFIFWISPYMCNQVSLFRMHGVVA